MQKIQSLRVCVQIKPVDISGCVVCIYWVTSRVGVIDSGLRFMWIWHSSGCVSVYTSWQWCSYNRFRAAINVDMGV